MDYTVFVHVVDRNGALLTQHDGQPASGEEPTSGWAWDQVVLDTHTVQIPHTAPPGSYEVRVGMYQLQTMQRLPVWNLDGIIHGDFFTLGSLLVVEK